MINNPFKRSPFALAYIMGCWVLITIGMAVLMVFILLPAKSSINLNGWKMVVVFLIRFYVGISLVFAYICSLPIIQLMTKYTDNEVKQPSLLGSKILYWQDVQEIRNITSRLIILVGSNTKIKIDLLLFENPNSLLAEIRSRIPEYAYPSNSQIEQEIYCQKQRDAGCLSIGAFIGAILAFVVAKTQR